MTWAVLVPPAGPVREPTRRRPSWQVMAGGLLLAALAWRFGAGPFMDGLRATTPAVLGAALLITAGTTGCCALRWRLVAAGHGEAIPLTVACLAYYRSQFLNATVPGGLVGDAHRGWRFGWRPVVHERVIGQLVQVALAATLVATGPWRWAAVTALVAVVARVGVDVAFLSAMNSLGHLAVFLVAASTVGTDLPPATLVAIGALVILGSSVPLSVAGWGPREGVAAWAFASYGSSASTGLSASVTLGVLSMVATLPGLAAAWQLRGSHA